MSPIMQRPYLVNNNQGFIKKKEDEESSQSSRSSQTNDEQPQIKQNSGRKDIQQELVEAKTAQQTATESRDSRLKNATVNIAQILKDFINTARAIGASPELTEEVETYLSLVEKQVL